MIKFTVTLNVPFAGETVWDCQTKHHADVLAAEFRVKGFIAEILAK